jgi:translation elongation factor aEF-1 beta
MRILPKDPKTQPDRIVESVKSSVGEGNTIRGKNVEPIAFGLYALILDIVTPEEEGKVDAVENAVSTAPLVGQAELLGVSRKSSQLHG